MSLFACTPSPLCHFLSLILGPPLSPYPGDVIFEWPLTKKIRSYLIICNLIVSALVLCICFLSSASVFSPEVSNSNKNATDISCDYLPPYCTLFSPMFNRFVVPFCWYIRNISKYEERIKLRESDKNDENELQMNTKTPP